MYLTPRTSPQKVWRGYDKGLNLYSAFGGETALSAHLCAFSQSTTSSQALPTPVVGPLGGPQHTPVGLVILSEEKGHLEGVEIWLSLIGISNFTAEVRRNTPDP